VVVTAQKRKERLIEVPLAVTAVSGDALASQQISDAAALVRAVPSLTYQQGNNPGNSSFRIRGVGAQLFGQGVESAVSVVVDGVVAARAAQGFTDLADIERVEVLRGPQGTLFGKNATAGVLNIVTARPARDFGGRVDVTVAEQDEYRLKGTLTGPISDTLRARVTGFYNSVGGHIRNVALNRDTNDYQSWGLRGKLEWDASDALNFLLSAEYRETDADCCSRVPVQVLTPAVATLIAPVVASPRNREVSNDDLSFSDTALTTASLQADYDLGPATITSISAWQRYDSQDQFEPDQIVSDPVRFVGPFAYSQWNFNQSYTKYDSFSQELRLGSNGSRSLTYVFGAFLSYLDMDRGLKRRRARCGTGILGQPCTAPLTFDSSGFDARFKSKGAALFGQVDYRLTGGLHLLAGLRGQYEEQEASGNVFGPLVAGDALFPGIIRNTGTRSRDDSAITGKTGVRYEFNRNTQSYATYTRGYKAFALDVDASTRFDVQRGLEPEHVDAYELGFKWRESSGMLDVNVAAFRSDYRNLQVQAIQSDAVTGVFQAVQLNAGKSRSQGLEIEATLRPSDRFTLPVNLTYLDATIDVGGQTCPLQLQTAAPILTGNFPVNACYRARTTVGGVVQTSGPIIDIEGGRLPLAPKWRVGISPRYEAELGRGLAGFVQANVNFQSDQQFSLEQDPLRVQDSYTLVDLNVGVRDVDNRYNLTLFVRNLFDVNYFTQLNHGTILASAASPNDLWANVPKDANRYVGATLGARF
jgi:iron complex outermembrane receptor protein